MGGSTSNLRLGRPSRELWRADVGGKVKVRNKGLWSSRGAGPGPGVREGKLTGNR